MGLVAVFAVPYTIVRQYRQYIVPDATKLQQPHKSVLLVLGGGVSPDGTPRLLLKNRLDAAVTAYNLGGVEHIIVSGDNRYDHYNEPLAMKNYLLQQQIPASAIQEDFAGRSTYESCERAAKIFGLTNVTIVSQRSHLARALYLCDQFGLKAVGLAAPDVSSISSSQKVRELFANVKAVGNVYFIGEKTILGEPIQL